MMLEESGRRKKNSFFFLNNNVPIILYLNATIMYAIHVVVRMRVLFVSRRPPL